MDSNVISSFVLNWVKSKDNGFLIAVSFSKDIKDVVLVWMLPVQGLNGYIVNFLALIPKVENADFIDNYDPIILCKFLFKLITKILANNLGLIVS